MEFTNSSRHPKKKKKCNSTRTQRYKYSYTRDNIQSIGEVIFDLAWWLDGDLTIDFSFHSIGDLVISSPYFFQYS